MADKSGSAASCRLGKVGGQAVMEGVMMKCGNRIALAVRRPDTKKINVRTKTVCSVKEKNAFLRLPVIRGIVSFAETLILSMGTLTESTEMLGIDEAEPETKFDKWVTEKLGDKMMKVISAISMVLGVALALVLFVWLPSLISNLIFRIESSQFSFASRCIDGGIKVLLFIAYIWLTSLIPDIKRVYMYHGAEHKSIACYESGKELTVENVRGCTRFHPRCGTSFMFLILLISIIVNSFILWGVNAVFPTAPVGERWFIVLVKLIALPIVVGVGYEYVMYAGKHSNPFTRIFSAPGLWMQRITTREPDDDMIEVGICSVKSALHDEFPDYEIPADDSKDAGNTGKEEPAADTAAGENDV